jgi:hypothetical protein
MSKSHDSGAKGELEIINDFKCPNCKSKLLRLPACFPLFDVQCERCLFRAQVKTARCAPKDEIFGAGWDILDKNLKAGHLIPPLIVIFNWQDKKTRKLNSKVLFFPFLTMKNIRRRKRSHKGKRPGYREFNYIGLRDEKLPQMVL